MLVIGHQGVQAKETCSNLSLPVAVEALSKTQLDQSRCIIHFPIILIGILYFKGHQGSLPYVTNQSR